MSWEKPLAADRRAAHQVCRLAEAKGLVLMTAFCKRYAEPYARAKGLIDGGAIGRPAMVAAKMCQAWAGARAPGTPALSHLRRGGGARLT